MQLIIIQLVIRFLACTVLNSAQIINGLIYDTATVFKNTNVNGYDREMSMISSIVHVYEKFCTNQGAIFFDIFTAVLTS